MRIIIEVPCRRIEEFLVGLCVISTMAMGVRVVMMMMDVVVVMATRGGVDLFSGRGVVAHCCPKLDE